MFTDFRMWGVVFFAGSLLGIFCAVCNLLGDGHKSVTDYNFITYVSLGNLVLSNDSSSSSTLSADQKKNLYVAQLFCHLVFLNLLLFQLSFEVAVNEDKETELVVGATTASDYALMLNNLPPQTSKQDIIDCFLHPSVVANSYNGQTDVLVEEMCCTCFDVKDLVQSRKAQDTAEVILSQRQNRFRLACRVHLVATVSWTLFSLNSVLCSGCALCPTVRLLMCKSSVRYFKNWSVRQKSKGINVLKSIRCTCAAHD